MKKIVVMIAAVIFSFPACSMEESNSNTVLVWKKVSKEEQELSDKGSEPFLALFKKVYGSALHINESDPLTTEGYKGADENALCVFIDKFFYGTQEFQIGVPLETAHASEKNQPPQLTAYFGNMNKLIKAVNAKELMTTFDNELKKNCTEGEKDIPFVINYREESLFALTKDNRQVTYKIED
jgi:hypothetical protein